jgi:hypothetical protein
MHSKLYYTSPSPIDASKQTVIFLHAAFMASTMWVDQIAYLKNIFFDVNLLQIDVNGYGKTTHGRKQFTLYDQCDDIVGLMVFIPKTSTDRRMNCLSPRQYLSGSQQVH